MAHFERYRGGFLSRAGVRWEVAILQEAAAEFDASEALTFPAEKPLEIMWEEVGKEDPVVSSSATLRIISPGDRTYLDLYTVRPCAVRMNVYRNGSLYWSGALDPEFYEEPYERGSDYEVTLTFSDFGILDRLNYTLSGDVSVMDIVRRCLTAAVIEHDEIHTGFISSYLKAPMVLPGESEYARRLSIDDVIVQSANFYDEDGEPSTLKEALAGVLQPLALRITQRNGKIWIYDLNSLATTATPKMLEWNGDRQTIGTDTVYNNITVKFSPYAADMVTDGSVDASDLKDEDEKLTFYSDYAWNQDDKPYEAFEFTPCCTSKSDALVIDDTDYPIRYFKMNALLGGQDCSGVAWLWRGSFPGRGDWATYNNRNGSGGQYYNQYLVQIPLWDNETYALRPIFRLRPGILANMGEDRPGLKLRVKMDILLDPRYNPFEDTGDFNEKLHTRDHRNFLKKVYIPCSLWVKTKSGDVWTYINRNCIWPEITNPAIGTARMPYWEHRLPQAGDYWLSYYNMEDMYQCFGDGWATNNQMPINTNATSQVKGIKRRGSGDYIQLPPVSGTLHFEVYAGIYSPFAPYEPALRRFVANIERWFLYRNVKIDITKSNGVSVENEDIEYSAVLNKDAKDGLTVETVCGSSPHPIPCARGLYVDRLTGSVLDKMRRGDAVDCPEVLFQATIFSQYAGRHAAISGECEISELDLSVFGERCQGDRRFILTESRQDLILDTEEVKAVEISPDNYQAVRPV